MPRISIILNTDTRPVCNSFQGMYKGVRSRDFLGRAGLENKLNFFKGHEVELIVFVDEHEPLSREEYDTIHSLADCTVVRKHSKYYRGADPFGPYNDVNFIHAFSLARGTHICHLDQDMAAFSSDPSTVQWMLDEVDSGRHAFTCYPSVCSPAPCEAPSYNNCWWVSTRFFLGKRESIDISALERAIRDNEWAYSTYSRPPIINPWTEGFLGVMSNYSVIYPYPNIDKWAVFPWMTYKDGTLEKLNAMPYGEVANLIYKAGGTGVFWDGIDVNLWGRE